MRKFLLMFILISAVGIPYAAAHPFTLETEPSSSLNAPIGITQVSVVFSEPVELDFSSIKIYDSNGDQIDNKDSKYFKGETSLVVTTPPLQEGVYTGTTKVLSKVDGHLVDSAFIFAVGDIKLDVDVPGKSTSELLFFPEAGARFPGLVGQTIVLGAIIGSMLIWGTQNKELIRKEIEKIDTVHHGRLMSITGIGLMLVFASNIIMLAVQTLRLETSAIDVIQTTFGTSWLVRMIITVILLGVWFWMDRKRQISKLSHIPMLVLSLALIGTSTIIGHGAASGQISAMVLDYVHNLVAAIWIGGIIYFVFALLPTFARLEKAKMEKMSLVMVPRFSIVFVISLGIVIISGPTLMWFLESDVGMITESTYGKLIIAKIVIASIMVGLGGFFQFKVQKIGERALKSKSEFAIHRKLKKSLKIDAILGIVLLGVVALLINGTLPAGEIQKIDAQDTVYGFRTIEYSENARFDIEITPFSSGSNSIFVKVSDLNNNPLDDSNELKVKISNPQKNIAPIEVPMQMIESKEGPREFSGEVTFGFSGEWQMEVEAHRTENANELVLLNLLVKPKLKDLRAEIIEYQLPETSKPLYPLYDGKNSIWVSDPSAPKIWKFDLDSKEFESFSFDGNTTMIMTIDNEGKIWFTDTPRNQIGYINPDTNEITTISLPKVQPVISQNTATFIQSDFDGNIWISITNKDVILKYDQKNGTFEEVRLPQRESLPFALTIDSDGKIWFTESSKGKIGYINTKDNSIKEFSPSTPLASPEALLFDDKGNLWIAEHTGLAIAKFNPVLETFERISVPNQEALPYGMSIDRYGNVWFAQHTVDNIGAYDPDNDEIIEVPIPTTTSFSQFTTTDSDDNVWFVEQQGNKLAMVKLTEVPVSIAKNTSQEMELKYTEIASPLMAMGIIATSLFFVKSVREKRKLNSLIMS